MKERLILRSVLTAIMALALISIPATAKKKNDGGRALPRFAETVYDFGTIKEDGGPVSHNFEFTNVGNGNLVILDATAECGCTRPEYPKNPIAPGKKNKIKITYNPIGRPGAFTKQVTIKINGEPRKIRLKIRGTVVPKTK